MGGGLLTADTTHHALRGGGLYTKMVWPEWFRWDHDCCRAFIFEWGDGCHEIYYFCSVDIYSSAIASVHVKMTHLCPWITPMVSISHLDFNNHLLQDILAAQTRRPILLKCQSATTLSHIHPGDVTQRKKVGRSSHLFVGVVSLIFDKFHLLSWVHSTYEYI